MAKSTVFVTQEQTKLNYMPAEKYGEIVFLTRDDFSPVAGSLSNVALIQQIKDKLAAFDPGRDYIVFSGSPTVAAAVFAHLGALVSNFKVLRWSNRDSQYTPITISL
jgi:hypothetical protein